MAQNASDRLDAEKQRIKNLAQNGDIAPECSDRILEYADALDRSKVRYSLVDDDGNTVKLSPGSVDSYLGALRRTITTGNIDLLNTTADEFNNVINGMHDDGGLAKNTLATNQVAAKHFFRYYSDLEVNPEDITVFSQRAKKKHDETDLFNESEVDALRRACGETRNPVRNRALLELLIFTGQRIGAIVTLRIKDVELESEGDGRGAYIYLNSDYDADHGGLKGALARGRRRPIWGAKKYVRDWIQYHPDGDNPEAWLFVGDPSHWKTDIGGHMARDTASERLEYLAECAGVNKPVNPHNFRHYCATVLYRDYDLDRDTIRMLLGHVEGSKSLETVYSHVLDEDFIRKAEEIMGYRETEKKTPFTPDTCPTCGELLKDGWRKCPSCEEPFGPSEDAEALADMATKEVHETALTESLSDEERKGLRDILELVGDTDALAEKLDRATSD